MGKVVCAVNASPEVLPTEIVGPKEALLVSDLVLVCSMNFSEKDEDEVTTRMVFFSGDPDAEVPDSYIFQMWVHMAKLLSESESLESKIKALCAATERTVMKELIEVEQGGDE